MQTLFPLSEYWTFYLGFTVFVLFLLFLDLGLFHRKSHKVSTKEAFGWTAVWVLLAMGFNLFLYKYSLAKFTANPDLIAFSGLTPELYAKQISFEFLTGYIVEESLSIDNIFVFVVIFNFFGIPEKYQHRVLFYGILGALLFRAIFIALGSILLQYHAVIMFFGIFLIITGIKIFFAPDQKKDLSKNVIYKLLMKFLPITNRFDGKRFFTKENSKLVATPLFVALVLVEFSDIIFAVDSVPAIFAITKEPLIVFTSNVFAILGLRSLYFVLANSVDVFHLLKYGLGIVLVFIGLKMVWLNSAFGGAFPIAWSLTFILGVISTSMILSWIIPQKSSD